VEDNVSKQPALSGETEVLVVDYVDEMVPVLARMAAKRRTGYRSLGYTVESFVSATEPIGRL
jgi:hypothetical protein